jgi:hypothetical protein
VERCAMRTLSTSACARAESVWERNCILAFSVGALASASPKLNLVQ